MGNEKMLVTMTLQELEELVSGVAYKEARKANSQLFKGLIPFLTKMNDDLEDIIKEQEYNKVFLNMLLKQAKDTSHD